MFISKLSSFGIDLHRSLAHQGFAPDFNDIGLHISMGMPEEDPDVFSGRFLQTLLHQDLSTSLLQKPLNLGCRNLKEGNE